ncbi:cupin domain-containing protein [Sphingomonas swuensis]|uniref:Cupin domain-containing protein n=1 Tax=Sphingomonas swuensis TaxID=977800 RepID=A0ABP7T4D7_9SPHN
MPKLDLETIEATNATGYPPPHDRPVQGRWYRRLAPAAGLVDFGASHVTLEPGAWSSQRHWHEGEDELVVMLEGEAMLVEEGHRTLLRAGDVAAFPKGVPDGHHLINEGTAPCRFVAIGRPNATDCHYPDARMRLDNASGEYRLQPES